VGEKKNILLTRLSTCCRVAAVMEKTLKKLGFRKLQESAPNFVTVCQAYRVSHWPAHAQHL
jgi:hypothetical protein